MNKLNYNVIGDIAGNYKTLMALLDKMPKGKVIAVGDIVDRGPNSKEVIDFFMKNEDKTMALMGNHEHMMVDYYNGNIENYSSDIWLYNGGETTLSSYAFVPPSQEILNWLSSREIFCNLKIDDKKYFISHTFLSTSRSLNEFESELMRKLWNRNEPWFNSESADVQICGHNSQFGLRYWNDIQSDKKAICIDSSRSGVLTGIHLPSMVIYQQEYID